VPLGIDPGDYWPLTRRRNGSEPYRFMWSGTPDWRKGWDLVYKAFWLAFQGSPEVELVMHFRSLPKLLAGCDDGNVHLVEGSVDRPALRRMYREADCYVFPSRGEGWGLPPREAAATGLPVIATDYGGLAEEIDEWALPLRVAREVPAEFGGWARGSIGDWAEPDLGHLVELMRWCAENREAAAAWGMTAADWLAEHGTWERTARAIMEVMEGC
jgi:glycosyltransferase involved in cell wall biosynthesis